MAIFIFLAVELHCDKSQNSFATFFSTFYFIVYAIRLLYRI